MIRLLLVINKSVSARNVFRHLYSIFVFAAFLVILCSRLLFGSLVFHCPRSFVLRVRVFLHIVYLAFIVILASVLRQLHLVQFTVKCLGFFSS